MKPLRLASILFTLIVLTLGMPIFWRAVATTEPTIHKAIQPMADSASIFTKADPATKAQVNESYGKLPLSFEPNRGQVDGQVKFLSRGDGYNLFLTSAEAVLTLAAPQRTNKRSREHLSSLAAGRKREKPPETVRDVLVMKLVDANTAAQVTGLDELPGKSNYFIGSDPTKWRTNVPNYAKVEYEQVWPGVNLIYYGNQRQLEYDFIVAPGADPRAIQLAFDGADMVKVDAQGNLVLHVAGGDVVMQKPFVYQEVNGARQEISGSYQIQNPKSKIQNPMVGFHVGEYDASQPLVIDPVLSYSTYLGGNNFDEGFGIAVDSSGNAYVTGQTYSPNFPTVNPSQATLGGSGDVFVVKLNPTGSALVYSTYLGGNQLEYGFSIAVDSSGNAYVTGQTNSANFPTANPLQVVLNRNPNPNPATDAFVAKLNPTGSALVYSTYLGGSNYDYGNSIAVDSSGNAYVTGQTDSANFPTANPLQAVLNVDPNPSFFRDDAFVAKLNPTGSALVYSTYLGGGNSDGGTGIAVDSAGNAYVTGGTVSTNFPTANPLQATRRGVDDAFVAKLNPAGSALVYSTYLGGSVNDGGNEIAVDSSGNAYVTGVTGSPNFPTVNPSQATLGGGLDAFVVKLNPAGSALVYSTYLGGSMTDAGAGIAVDSSGNAYVTGLTNSPNFPTANPLQATLGGVQDAFVAKINTLNPADSALVYSTYLGGTESDSGYGIALTAVGTLPPVCNKPTIIQGTTRVFVTGTTTSNNFPLVRPLQPNNRGGADAFVTRIDDTPTPGAVASANSQSSQQATRMLASGAYGNLPLSFEANQGQTDNQVKFLSRGPGYNLFLTPSEAVLRLRGADSDLRNEKVIHQPSDVLRLKLVGANPHSQMRGQEELPSKSNYFIGSDQQQYHANISHYAKVQYQDVYPGVDLIYYGNQRQLEYDLVVSPGTNPKAIKLAFEGAKKLEIDAQGDLILYLDGGEVRQHKPVIYQEIAGVRQIIPGRYVRQGKHEVGFQVAKYDRRHPLIIDPVLSYSTYLGGLRTDEGYSIAVDAAGNAYITGRTFLGVFPTVNPLQTWPGDNDFNAFVTKINAAGTAMVYSTYLGGLRTDEAFGIAVDTAGNAYVTGRTFSQDFPTVNASQTWPGDNDFNAFVTKINAAGSALVYSTYLGGLRTDEAFGIAVNAAGNAYVTGRTFSQDFPTVNASQTWPGDNDFNAFVTKLKADGSGLVYSTYLGGLRTDEGYSIAVDAADNAYATGRTFIGVFPTVNPLQTWPGDNDFNAFVTKFNPSGTPVYSTYLGGLRSDCGCGIAVDTAGSAYVTGFTFSQDFPTANAFRTWPGDNDFNAFVTKINAAGSALAYSTYLGGLRTDEGYSIAVDAAGNAYVTGRTFLDTFPTVNPVMPWPGDNDFNAFVTKFNASGSPVYSTYLGGLRTDEGFGIAADANGNAYVTGRTFLGVFPTVNPLQTWPGDNDFNAFVTKITDTSSPTPTPTPTPSDTVPLTSAIPQTGSIPAPDPGFGRLSGIQYTIQVPSGATQLSVNLSGNQDVDLFVRFGQRITVSGGAVVADFKSESLTGNESITITPSSSPALQPGTYFIAVANFGPGAASFTLTATVTGGQPTTNPIDNPGFFVRQHYLDFLNRVPDQAGLDFWTAQITSCGTDAACIELKRINVSAAYFLSSEFQQTGYLVERLYKAAYGDANGTSTIGGAHQLPVPIVRFNDFLPDTQRIGNGVVVGQTGWETVLENNKQAFTAEFVQRSRFTMAFPLTMTTAQFVDKLNMNAGNPLSQAERDNLVNSGMTRAQILRAVAEDQDLNNAEFNRAFVLMQFFGYLRRNPNDPPDTDYSGFEFWLTKLNQFNGNFQNAEMVKAFITSIEYRQRFGP